MRKPDAVVVGSGLNALGVVRSLAPERISVTVVDTAPGGPAARSRFGKPNLYHGSKGEDPLLAHLLTLPLRSEHPVLFLTQEASVALVSKHREQLAKRYRFLLAHEPLLADLMDKRRFQERAAALKAPVPRAITITARSEITRAETLRYPVILKPLTKNETWERQYQKAYRFAVFQDLLTFLDGINDPFPPVIVQEWIEGTDSDVYFTLVYRDEAGRTCASFTGRKLRQWPPLVGGTASCTAAPQHEAELAALTSQFFDAVGFVGMGSMEFKRDPRTGRFVMVEPTVGRSDYQEEVATLNGVNVVRAAYRSLAGLTPGASDSRVSLAIWRDEISDERSRLAQPGLTMPEEVASAVKIDALFRMNDPGPWLSGLVQRISTRLGRSRR